MIIIIEKHYRIVKNLFNLYELQVYSMLTDKWYTIGQSHYTIKECVSDFQAILDRLKLNERAFLLSIDGKQV